MNEYKIKNCTFPICKRLEFTHCNSNNYPRLKINVRIKTIQKNKKLTKARPKVNIPDSVENKIWREMSKFELVFHRLESTNSRSRVHGLQKGSTGDRRRLWRWTIQFIRHERPLHSNEDLLAMDFFL